LLSLYSRDNIRLGVPISRGEKKLIVLSIKDPTH
jgi:hypothetical protein